LPEAVYALENTSKFLCPVWDGIFVGDFPARAVLVYGPHEKVFIYKELPEFRYKDS
jgi:hypothetical protein